MIRNQKKMMMTTRRNSQWRQPQLQPKIKEYQNKGDIFQRNWKYHSTVEMKIKKMKVVEKIMFAAEDAPLGFKVGSNHLILQNIMAHMNFSTLKRAREVSKDWKKLANLELGIRKCAQWRLSRFWRSERRIIRNSDDVSWLEFDLKYMSMEELDHFAKLFGRRVKVLKLAPLFSTRFTYGYARLRRTIWDCLGRGKFSNLEILEFHAFGPLWYVPNNWKPLQWTSKANAALPNLKRIEGLILADASLLPSKFLKYKGHLVKSATLHSSSCDPGGVALNQMTLLAQAKPELERFAIREIEGHVIPELIMQIDLILESSRESLRVLEMSFFSNFPFYFQPQPSQTFTKLSTLHFCIRGSGFDLKIQLESLNQDCVPNLKTVKIGISSRSQVSRPDPLCFSPTKRGSGRGRLNSVVDLELQARLGDRSLDFLPSNWFTWLSTCFPNVKNLNTECWKDTDVVLRQIFTLWPKLTSLKIRPDFCYFGDKFDLDPVLTGLSLEKCQELRNNSENMKMANGDVLSERTWPNLNSLKELKRLEFYLLGSYFHPYWSHVSLISFLYAINLRPELKTTIRFPAKADHFLALLEPLAPFATLESILRPVSPVVQHFQS